MGTVLRSCLGDNLTGIWQQWLQCESPITQHGLFPQHIESTLLDLGEMQESRAATVSVFVTS